MIYVHEMRGADRAIASAIDAHVNAERGGMTVLARRAKGTLMARSLLDRLLGSGDGVWIMRLSWAYVLERATGIEPAWPAWKAGALPLSYARAWLQG